MSDADELDAELLALADEESGEEEEEASAPGSPDSLGSGAMSESEDEGGIDEPAGAQLYPLEGKYKDSADKARLSAMSEIEREQVLAERADEVHKQQQDQRLEQLFQKKRSAAAADLDDNQRKASRPKIKVSDPLESYKRQRQQRGEELERQRDRKERKGRASRSPSSRGQSDRDADGDSEVEYDTGYKAAPREDPPADTKDIEKAMVKRENFAKVCFWPGFEDAMIGCFCRVSVGPGENGHNTYRIGQIKAIEIGKPYAVENEKGKQIMTDQYVVAKHGKDVKTVPFSHCSNSKFTDTEFERFKSVLSSEGIKFPVKSYVHAKLDDIAALLAHRFTEDELNVKLEKQNKYAGELARLTANAAPKAKSAAQLQAERLEALNRENRKRNQEEIRKALLAERKADKKARALAAAKYQKKLADDRLKAEHEAAKARLAESTDDLFGGSDLSRTGTPDPAKLSRTATPLPRKEPKGIPTFKKKTLDDDVIASMDFGVDIDI